ncbi:transposase [Streptomyces sp. NPDC055092]
MCDNHLCNPAGQQGSGRDPPKPAPPPPAAARHYLDSGYPSADLIVSAAQTYGIALVSPVLLDTSRQPKAQQGFAAHDFTIDWNNKQAICPAGKTSTTWNDVIQEGVAKTVVSFAALDCIPCPVKEQCTSSRKGRQLSQAR